MSKTRIRLLLVNDHFFVRMGLASSINAEPDLRVVAEADNGLQAIEQFRAHRPDVVILDGRKPLGRPWSAASCMSNSVRYISPLRSDSYRRTAERVD